ncbi:MAG: trypsin-like peptidase domain-containing protein [Hyphomicrobium sp.]
MRPASAAWNRAFHCPAMAGLCLATALFSNASAAVFGDDDRRPLPQERRALADKIGALTSGGTGAACSAFCLAPNIIATTSHCVFGTAAKNRPALSSLRFSFPHRRSAQPAGIGGRAIGNEAQNIVAGAETLKFTPPIGAAHDWAVLKLDSDACRAGGLPLSTPPQAAAVDDDRSAPYQVALHQDLGWPALQLDQACDLQAAPSDLAGEFADWQAVLLHTCDTGGGSSGSPMLVDRGGKPEAVALNVGTYLLSRSVPSAANEAKPPPAPIANTAIRIEPLVAALHALHARNLLETPEEVARLQQRLKFLALYKGPENGRVDGALVGAVLAYERAKQRRETGLLTRELLSELEGVAGAKP